MCCWRRPSTWWKLRIAVAEEKALKWAAELEDMMQTRKCDPDRASRFAGRFGFACTLAAGKVGRAFVRPFYAQAHAPMPGFSVSPLLMRAGNWWHEYLRLGPTLRAVPNAGVRRHLVCYTDASGVDRMLAAVVYDGISWYFARTKVSEEVMGQLLQRNDNQIGVLEMLAVALLFWTFPVLLSGSAATIFIDNDGVLYSLLKGASRAPEMCIAAGHIWLKSVALETAMWFGRVESKANLADGPTRCDLRVLEELGAFEVESVLPEWMSELWVLPAVSEYISVGKQLA